MVVERSGRVDENGGRSIFASSPPTVHVKIHSAFQFPLELYAPNGKKTEALWSRPCIAACFSIITHQYPIDDTEQFVAFIAPR